MKKLVAIIISVLMVFGLILSGCGKTNKEAGQADVPTQEADAAAADSQQDTTKEETADNNAHVIEGWPDDVPAPDFGGEITRNNPGAHSITLTFRGIDPAKAAQYIQKLKDAGFTSWLSEEDKTIDAYVDADGNYVIHHSFSAAKGEPVYHEAMNLEFIENGYYIRISYSDVDEYLADGGNFVSKPKVELYIDWENPLVEN